ncbi:MAG: MFS transporter [Aminivibrio sp.]|uniref:MFS transporter n=1 Tax=Aminivibrio sp. TaxID=1872489 RepID=UPI002B214477|nr:MFS transporter [Aminivibrio sp.]MEA4952995.1 MFS transporter [Aminivibrio sp.]
MNKNVDKKSTWNERSALLLLSTEGSYRKILTVLSLSMFCAMLGIGIIAPVLPLYAKRLGASGLAIGTIIGAFSFSRSGGMLISGELAERMNRKVLLLAGLAFYALASVAYTFASTTESLIAIRIGHGIGSAMVVPITMAIGAEVVPKGKEGLFFGSLQGALFLGVGSGPLLSGLLAETIGFNAPFYAMTSLTVLSMILVFRFLPGNLPSGRGSETLCGLRSVFQAILTDHEMLVVFFFQFCSAMCRGVLVMMIPLLASDIRLSLSEIGFVVSLNSLSTGVLQRFSGRLADNLHKHRLILAGGLISAVTLLGLPNLRTPWSLSIASVVFGVGHAFASPSLAAMAAARGKTYGSGRIMGLFNIAFSLGMTTGPVVVGILLDHTGKGLPFYLLSAALLLSAYPFLSLKETR